MSTRPRRGDSAEPVGLLGLANGRPSGGEFGGRWRIRLDYPYLSKSLNGEGGIRTGYPYNGFRDRSSQLRLVRAAILTLGGCRWHINWHIEETGSAKLQPKLKAGCEGGLLPTPPAAGADRLSVYLP